MRSDVLPVRNVATCGSTVGRGAGVGVRSRGDRFNSSRIFESSALFAYACSTMSARELTRCRFASSFAAR
jgi:hypothetical protein